MALELADQKNMKSFEMWCQRRMEKISWTDRVKNEDVLQRVKAEEEYPTYSNKEGKRSNCLLKHTLLNER